MNKKIIGIFSIFVIISFFTTLSIPNYAILQSTNETIVIADINRDSWWWEATELVSVESTDDSIEVDSTMDGNNNLHVVWSDDTDYGGSGADQDIFYKKYNTNTNTWSPTEVVSTESDGDGDNPSVIADYQGNVHVVWIDTSNVDGSGTDSDVFYKAKDSSTNLWSTVEVVSTGSSEDSLKPDLVVDNQGNTHVAWHDNFDYDGSDVDIIYKKRDAVSEIWSAFTIVSSESTDSSYGPRLALDSSDNVHVVWYDYTNDMYGSGGDRDIFYKKWDPDNLWSQGITLSFESTGSSTDPYIVIDVSDNIHVAWDDPSDIDGVGTDTDIFYRKWDSSKFTWSALNILSPESTSSSREVCIIVDSYSNVHFVWTDFTNILGAGTDADIFYRILYSDTDNLSDLTIISDLSNALPSLNPAIELDSREHLHVVWYDYANDMLDSGSDVDVFYKRFVGSPVAPILAEIFPNTKVLGNLTLNWEYSLGANEYKIFRSESYIWDVDGLAPIDTISDNYFLDTIESGGIYYYVVTASSDYGDSDLSNVVSVEILDVACLDCSSGFFDNINWGEVTIIGGAVLVLQLIVSVIMIVTNATRVPAKSSSKKGKK